MTPSLKTILAVIFLTIITQFSYSQKSYYFFDQNHREPNIVLEAGLVTGGINAITDIGGNRKIANEPLRSFTLYNTKFMGGAYFSGTYKGIIAARLQYVFGLLVGADSLTAKVENQKAQNRATRNLSYRTPVRELSLGVEFHPDFLWANSNKSPAKFSPYIMVGLGYLSYKPQTYFGNQLVDLRPLSLEGQGFAEYPNRNIYKTHAITVPVGLGVRYELGPKIYLRAEAGMHLTNTDYLDDASESVYIDPDLFYKYLPEPKAWLATQLFNRDTRNTEENFQLDGTRAKTDNKDLFWTASLKLGLVLNRKRL